MAFLCWCLPRWYSCYIYYLEICVIFLFYILFVIRTQVSYSCMCDLLFLYIICDSNPSQQCVGGKFKLVLLLVSFMSNSARELSTIHQVLDSHVSRYLIIFTFWSGHRGWLLFQVQTYLLQVIMGSGIVGMGLLGQYNLNPIANLMPKTSQLVLGVPWQQKRRKLGGLKLWGHGHHINLFVSQQAW